MVSPDDIRKALSGMDHPAGKNRIVAYAEKQGGNKEAIEALRKIEDRQYEGPSGVSSAVFD